MAKRKPRNKNKSRQDRRQPVDPRTRRDDLAGGMRNQSLDTLRGVAIALMVIDHFCYFFGDTRIAPDSLRMMTRLSMPLFCILTGYLALRPARRDQERPLGKTRGKSGDRENRAEETSWLPKRWLRLGQVVFACLLLNAVLLREMGGRLEILASILVGYALLSAVATLTKRSQIGTVVIASLALMWSLFPWDVSRAWFDYPLTIVISCIAVGALMQRSRNLALGVATLTAAVLCLGRIVGGEHAWVSAPSVYVMIAEPLAAWLVAAAVGKPKISIPVLTWVGRFPLSIYVSHYLLFYLMDQWVGASN